MAACLPVPTIRPYQSKVALSCPIIHSSRTCTCSAAAPSETAITHRAISYRRSALKAQIFDGLDNYWDVLCGVSYFFSLFFSFLSGSSAENYSFMVHMSNSQHVKEGKWMNNKRCRRIIARKVSATTSFVHCADWCVRAPCCAFMDFNFQKIKKNHSICRSAPIKSQDRRSVTIQYPLDGDPLLLLPEEAPPYP